MADRSNMPKLPEGFDPNAPVWGGPARPKWEEDANRRLADSVRARWAEDYAGIAAGDLDVTSEVTADYGMVEPQPTVLEEARELIYGQRVQDYGHPKQSMEAISAFWDVYVRLNGRKTIGPDDAACMLLLMKVARYLTGKRGDRDTVVDMAGYAGVLARTIGLDD